MKSTTLQNRPSTGPPPFPAREGPPSSFSPTTTLELARPPEEEEGPKWKREERGSGRCTLRWREIQSIGYGGGGKVEKRGDPNRRRREGGTLNASSSGGAAKDGGRDRGVRGGKEGDVEEICNWGRIVKRGESESEEGKGMEEEAHSFHFRPPMSLGRCAAHREKGPFARRRERERKGERERERAEPTGRRPPSTQSPPSYPTLIFVPSIRGGH